MDSVLLSRIEQAISISRMQTYRDALTGNAGVSDEDIIVLYLWNQTLSESLYSSLSFIEVALRSAMHKTLTHTLGPAWFPNVFKGQALTEYNSLVQRLTFKGALPSDSQIVANLTFGKWVNMIVNGKCIWVN